MQLQPWQLHPWIISSWPIIERPRDSALRIATDLHHLGTVVSSDCDEYGRLLGHSIWGIIEHQIGVAWDWTETMDGVFALSDPMGVVSNIEFIDDCGVGIEEASAAVQLNRIAHALPWQAEVAAVTRRRRTETPWQKRLKPMVVHQFRPSELGGFALSR